MAESSNVMVRYSDGPRSITPFKLNNVNYLAWAHAVKIYLTAEKKLKHLTDLPPATNSDDWNSDDAKVMCWLWHSIEPHIANTVASCNTSKEIWDSLAESFSQTSNASRVYDLYEKIFTTKQNGQALSEYYSKLKSLWDQLLQHRLFTTDLTQLEKQWEDFMAATLLAGLDSGFSMSKDQILAGETLPTAANAFFRLSRSSSEQPFLKTLKLAFYHPSNEVTIHSVRLPKQYTVSDLLNELKTRVELSYPDAELRLLQIRNHKIYRPCLFTVLERIFPRDEKIETINDQQWLLRADEISEEEKNLAPTDSLIHVYHFKKESGQNQMQIQNFGEPLADIKVRIQKRLQFSDEEFCEWKFAFVSNWRPDLQDSDIIRNYFQRSDIYGDWERYLGLEHLDTVSKKAYAVNQECCQFLG